jgi:hypothetical protein
MEIENYYSIGQPALSFRLISQLSRLEGSLMDEATSELKPNQHQSYVGLHFPSGPATAYAQQSRWSTRPTVTVYQRQTKDSLTK